MLPEVQGLVNIVEDLDSELMPDLKAQLDDRGIAWREIGPCLLINGGAQTVLPLVPEVSAVVADPPYGETSLEWDKQPCPWVHVLPGNSFWCFGSLRMFMGFGDQLGGWKLSQDVIWEKHNGSNFHADRFKRVHEIAAHFYRGRWSDVFKVPQKTMDATKRTLRRKQRPPHTGHIDAGHYASEDGGPRLQRSVIQVRSCHGHAQHPTQKPVGIILPLVRYSSPEDGVVLDPFMGSGSTGVACIESGRRFIGIEIDADYYTGACDRIERVWREKRSELPYQEIQG